jgi:RNA polymerase primary sigma factor
MLTAAQEAEAAQRIKCWIETKASGTELHLETRRRLRKEARAAEDLLVRSHLRLVMSVAERYRKPWVEFDDLVAEGNYALVRAARDFPFKGSGRFGGFAKGRVRAAAGRLADVEGYAPSVPERQVRRARQFERLKREEFVDVPYKPVDRLIAEAGPGRTRLMWLLNLTDDAVAELERLTSRALSLSTPVGQGSLTLADTLYYRSNQGPVTRQDLEHTVHVAFLDACRNGVLDPRQWMCVAMRYGLFGVPQQPLSEMADQLRVSETTVRKILDIAVNKLRQESINKQLLEQVSGTKRSTAPDEVATWQIRGAAFA